MDIVEFELVTLRLCCSSKVSVMCISVVCDNAYSSLRHTVATNGFENGTFGATRAAYKNLNIRSIVLYLYLFTHEMKSLPDAQIWRMQLALCQNTRSCQI